MFIKERVSILMKFKRFTNVLHNLAEKNRSKDTDDLTDEARCKGVSHFFYSRNTEI